MPNAIKNFLNYPKAPFKLEVSDKTIDKKVHLVSFTEKPISKKKSDEPLLPDFPYFKAALGETVEGPEVWHIGLGNLTEIDFDQIGSMFLRLATRLITKFKKIQIVIPSKLEQTYGIDALTNLLITGLGVACYPVDLLKNESTASKKMLQNVILKVPKQSLTKYRKYGKKYLEISKHINGMRQVQALPGNYLDAIAMEKRTKQIAKDYSLTLKVFKQPELKKMGAGGILAVNQGSTREPRMLILEYKPEKMTRNTKTLALVGKGVTFDTGGISLKPSAEMHDMKYDMSGSAAVVHAVAAIAEQKLPVHVVGAVGMVENMPGGNAFKPGDVYTSLKGETIEVQNTDAEGRLVLGDVLHYTETKYKPDLMINLATLTGAILVALGPYYAGLFTPGDQPREIIEKAAENSLEPVWSMPMSKRFKEMLKSNIADYNNIGGRLGGSCTAAAFLSIFVDKPESWAHLDIAGVGFIKKSFNVYPAVASGYGIRLLTEVAQSLT